MKSIISIGPSKKPGIVKATDHQTGKTDLKADKEIKALLPGKRLSKNKKIYYEYRKNRSDLKGNV